MTRAILTLIFCVGLAACHNDSTTPDSLSTPVSAPASGSNVSPTVSGSPSTQASVGTAYSFTPAATDPDSQSLSFSIQQKPSWANFNTTTGALSGTPTSSDMGTVVGIVISVTDGSSSASLAPFSIAVGAAGTGGPMISGAPLTTIAVGTAYSFTPTSSDASGEPLTFSIRNMPPWATFNESTGQLSGTPTASNIGVTSNIVISATDGTTTVSLDTFDLSVTQIGAGSATLSWTPPTQNTDGSSLTDLAGYRIHYGLSSGNLTQSIQVSSAGITNYVISNLTPATWYFSVKAYTSKNVESDFSAVVNKIIK
jgi:hypothetical protein